MTRALLAAAPDHTTTLQWLWFLVPMAVLLTAVSALVVAGKDDGQRSLLARPWTRAASSLRRLTGLPGWCAGGLLLAMWALGVAVVGFVWDVAWHIDLGRDTELFTVPHTLILTGLMGIGAAALASIGLATAEGADTPWRLGALRIPRGALALGVLSAGAACGFPLDDIWHANYGVDVTMWGPTHLLMIGGASFSPIAMWLLYAEAGPEAGHPWVRMHVRRLLAGATVIGLSTFQLEFDDGVPQWQALYQPVLIMLATSIGLVAARVAFGRWRALLIAVNFLVLRGILALLVGPGLGHVVPRFPLYLGIAAVIELGAHLMRRRPPLPTALVCGALAGTVGLASEWAFSHVWGRHPWQLEMVPHLWVALMAALAGAVVGIALGRVVTHRGAGVPKRALVLAFAAVAASIAIPMPRTTTPITAVMRTAKVGPSVPAVDRNGLPSPYQAVSVDLTLAPPDAAQGADYFEVLSWQGGGESTAPLVPVGPGEYRTAAPVPSGATWKSLVMLVKGSEMMATPVAMPLDLEYAQAAVTPRPLRTVQMVAASSLLMRESHGGAAWPMILAYTGLLTVALVWIGVLVLAFASVSGGGGGTRGRRAPSRRRTATAVQPGFAK